MTKDMIIIADYSEDISMSLDEICEICGIEVIYVQDLVAYDIITPQGTQPERWVFDMNQLKRLRMAQRLQRDLELNLAGVALVLEMLDELEELRAKSEILEKHILK